MKKLFTLIALLLLPLTASAVFIVDQGGTGSTTLSGLLKGNGKSMVQTATAGTDYVLPTTLGNYLSLSSWYATNTDALHEGSTNLYFTNPRVLTYLDTLSKGYFFSTTSADAWDLTKSRWATTSNTYWLTQQTTDGLAEGSTNKYDKTVAFTNGTNVSMTGTYPNFTIADSLFPTFTGLTVTRSTTTNATTTNLAVTTLCLTGDTCRTTWPTSGGGSGVGTIATSSQETADEIPFYTSTNGYPALLGTNADFTYAPAPSSILSVPNVTVSSEIRGGSIRDLTGVAGFNFPAALTVDAYVGDGALFTINNAVSGIQAGLSLGSLTGNTIGYFPNQASYTFATDNDLTNYVPYTGATTNLDLGVHSLWTDSITGSSQTNSLTILGIDSAIADTAGQPITIRGGKGNGTGDGTYVNVTGGDSGDTDGIGGGVGLSGGHSYGASHGGNIELAVGDSATGANGKFIFNQNLIGGALGVLDFSLLGTSEKTFQFPNQSGTLALLSDISGATASSTLYADTGTFSGVNIFNNKVGIGTTTPFGFLSVVSNGTPPEFVVATSTGSVPTFMVNSTSSSASGQRGGLVSVNTSSYYTNSQLLDSLVINGAVNTMDWKVSDCTPSWATLATDGNAACADSTFWSFYEDGTAQQSLFTAPVGNPGAKIESTASTANDGGGVFAAQGVAWTSLTKNTPILEAQMAINGAATGTLFYFGFTNLNNAASSFEVPPTQGCYLTASTTKANWQAICSTSASAMTIVDTGVASSTTVGGRGTPMRYRVESNGSKTSFYIGTSSSFLNVANITNNIPASTTRLIPGMYMSWISGAPASNTRDIEWSRLKLTYQNNPNLEIFIP